MTKYSDMSREELELEYAKVKQEYEAFHSKGLNLDMSRGKPGPDQLSLSSKVFDLVCNGTGFRNRDGIDCRNYGGLDGLSELKELFGEILGMPADHIIVGGNSSLNMMFDVVAQAMTHGMGNEPWLLQGKVKFLCPVPGYDRHFTICEHFGIEMINVPMTAEGPDTDVIEQLIKDPLVKGMWCVPKYSNPDGVVYSDKVVKKLASLKPAANDFRIFWDNAYAVHPVFSDTAKSLLNLYDECLTSGNPDLVIMFTSTSKITFPGAGVAALAASPRNIKMIKNRMNAQTIGADKLNQLRHTRMFPDLAAVQAHMRLHATTLKPKFETVLKVLNESLNGLGIAKWTNPDGGYFISMFVEDGCAKRVGYLCKQAGLTLTTVGATYPLGIDPQDSNIRIAPSYPLPDELKTATELLCVSTKLAVLEKIMKI